MIEFVGGGPADGARLDIPLDRLPDVYRFADVVAEEVGDWDKMPSPQVPVRWHLYKMERVFKRDDRLAPLGGVGMRAVTAYVYQGVA